VYRKEFAKVAAGALERGQNAIHRLFEDEHVRTGVREGIRAIEAKELMGAGFAPEIFRNINTVTDLESID
jgi:molybdopterin-guanine dinucleotide biosynthesis protein A